MSEVIDIGYRPRSFQTQLHTQAKRFTVCVAHRRFGKTLAAVATLVHCALATKRTDARFGYMAPYLKQSKGTAWDYLRNMARPVPGTRINEGELSIEFANGSRIRLFGGDNPEGLRGLYFDGIVIDEVADIRPHVWSSIVRPALSDRRGWALFIGTPKGINLFYELYENALHGFDRDGVRVLDPDWTAMMFKVSDTKLIADDELQSSRAVMSDAQFRQEWLCDFSAATDNTLITVDMVSAATQRFIPEGDLAGATKILGVDVARFGDDRSCIVRRHGQVCFEPMVFRGIDNMELASRVAWEINEWKPDAVFVDGGRGEGVIDRLRQLGFSIIEVAFGGKAMDNHFANKRTEIWHLMAQWLKDGGSLPPAATALREELCVPTYSFDSNGRMVLESKDAIKERMRHSPDCADGLALTFALPVAPAPFRHMQLHLQQQNPSDYDPFRTLETE